MHYKNPLGYKVLRTWQQANEIFELTEEFATTLPLRHPKTGQYLTDLKDQMIRSARSVVRNIEEGYVRTSTKEYISFLGFSIGSLEELLSDFEYCQKGELGDDQRVNKAIYLCRGEFKMLKRQIEKLSEKQPKSAREILADNMNKEKQFDAWLNQFIEKPKE